MSAWNTEHGGSASKYHYKEKEVVELLVTKIIRKARLVCGKIQANLINECNLEFHFKITFDFNTPSCIQHNTYWFK